MTAPLQTLIPDAHDPEVDDFRGKPPDSNPKTLIPERVRGDLRQTLICSPDPRKTLSDPRKTLIPDAPRRVGFLPYFQPLTRGCN